MQPVFRQTPPEGSLFFVTLTAPSFGSKVHNREKGTKDCTSCGERHSATDDDLGYPLNANNNRFWEAVQWNYLAPRLWNRYITELRRSLGEESVSYFVAFEMQTRQVGHYHALLRVTGDPVKAEEKIRSAQKVKVNPSAAVVDAFDGKAETHGFGSEMDVRVLPAGSEERKTKVAYVTKSVIAYTSKDIRESETGELSHVSRTMRSTANRYLPHLGHRTSRSGYIGSRYSFSRDWGLSAGDVRLYMTLGWMKAHGKADKDADISAAIRYVDKARARVSDEGKRVVHENDAIHDAQFYLRNDSGKFPSEHDTEDGFVRSDRLDQLTEAAYATHD